MTGFLETLFRDTTAAVELRACENDYGGGAKSMMTSGANEEWKLFVRRHNRDGWGVYFGVCTRRIGSPTGKRGDLVECPAVWLDIDCRKLGVAGADAIRALDTCPLPPSIVVNSGNGLHAYWVLREPIDVAKVDCEAEQRLLAVMKQLVGVFAGDVKCCELARILRLPGTHNSKSVAKAANDGQAIECQVMSMEDERRYELEEIEEWLERQRPLLTVAPELRAVAVPDDVFTAYAKKAGLHPPLDVSAALAAMALGGEGDSSIHQTQIKVSASLAARGHDDDAILDILLPATMKAAGPYAAAWNWRREEQNLRRMIATARTKFPAKPKPSLSQEAPADSARGGDEAARPTAMVASMGANVTNISSARAKKETKAAAAVAGGDDNPGRSPTEAIARGVLAKIEGERGRLVTLGGNEMYLVERGRWRPFANNPVLEGFLDREINGMTRAFQKEPKPALMSGVKNMLRTMPELHRGDIKLDTEEWIACNDGSINASSGEIAEHDPDHMTTIGIDCDIRTATPGAGIERWRAFLAEAFSNLPAGEAAAMIATLQEIMGAALVRRKPREMSRAAILHGEGGCGKTTVADITRQLLGGPGRCAAISIKELGEKFGLHALVGKAAWIGDDAIGRGDKLDAERFKLIVTNENISISRKNLPDWEGKLDLAVLLTSNHTPRIIDTSNAVYSRLLIMPMKVTHDDRGNSDEMKAALYAETAGILLWAIAGWQRLRARGHYDPPATMTGATARLKETNNPLQTCMAECVALDEHRKVHRRDLLAMARGWFEENYGERARGQELAPQTLLHFMEDRFPQLDFTLRTGSSGSDRYTGGIRLNEAGLQYWERYRAQRNVQGATVTHAKRAIDVNVAIKWEAPF